MQIDFSTLSSAIVIVCAMVLLIVVALLFFVALNRKQRNLFLREIELMEARNSQMLLESKLEIQEQTFQEISYEIHDNIGQVLSLVRLNVNTLGQVPDAEKIDATDLLLGNVIADLRSLSHNLNKDHIVQNGLVPSVQKVLSFLGRTGKFRTSYSGLSDIELPEDVTIVLFRITQELLNNIVKHANATEVHVSIELEKGERLKIEVIDDGQGFDKEVVDDAKMGIGLKNVVNRATMIGASIGFSSSREAGTKVTLTLNL